MAESTALDTLAIWSYWILGVLIVGTMCYILYTKGNKQVAAVLTFLISMLALYYYYVKWFIIGDSYNESVTVCPDFMSVLKTYDNTTKQLVCYDSGNVYKKNEHNGTKADALTKFTKTDASSGGLVNNGEYVITPNLANPDNVKNLCSSLKIQGMSWLSACKTVNA